MSVPSYVVPCTICKGLGHLPYPSNKHFKFCPECQGVGFVGIDPELPCIAPAGSNYRVAVMAQRYLSGFPIWNAADSQPILHQDRFKKFSPAEPDPHEEELVSAGIDAAENDSSDWD